MKREYSPSPNCPENMREMVLNELKLGYLNLADGAFEQAKLSFDLILKIDSECADAFWGLMLEKFQIKNEDELENQPLRFKSAVFLPECKNALKFAGETQKAKFENLLEDILKINEGDNY